MSAFQNRIEVAVGGGATFICTEVDIGRDHETGFWWVTVHEVMFIGGHHAKADAITVESESQPRITGCFDS